MAMTSTSRRIGRALTLLALGVAYAACAAPSLSRAEGIIYLCVDAVGHKELTDINKGGCRPLDLPGVIPAPARRAAAPRVAAPAVSPAAFPKVDAAQQKARDDGRRQILEDELSNEEKKLAALRKDFNGGEPERNGNERNYAKYQERTAQLRDDVSRAEQNVEALKREIANIR